MKKTKFQRIRLTHKNFWVRMEEIEYRGVSEWLKVQSWKGCVGATPPRVRISSPLDKRQLT